MDRTQVTCEFAYTDAEYRKCIVCVRRSRSTGYIQWFWLVVTIGFVLMITDGLYVEYQNGELSDANGLKWADILSAEAPFGIALLLQLLILFTPLYGFIAQPLFRGSMNRNKRPLFRIGLDKITEEMDGAICSFPWSAFKRAREYRDGFVLSLDKRLYYWLPRHGFSSSEDINFCRTLLRDKIKDFQSLF